MSETFHRFILKVVFCFKGVCERINNRHAQPHEIKDKKHVEHFERKPHRNRKIVKDNWNSSFDYADGDDHRQVLRELVVYQVAADGQTVYFYGFVENNRNKLAQHRLHHIHEYNENDRQEDRVDNPNVGVRDACTVKKILRPTADQVRYLLRKTLYPVTGYVVFQLFHFVLYHNALLVFPFLKYKGKHYWYRQPFKTLNEA